MAVQPDVEGCGVGEGVGDGEGDGAGVATGDGAVDGTAESLLPPHPAINPAATMTTASRVKTC